jgi:hypothetical protein
MRDKFILPGLIAILILSGADDAPPAPKSPKATDAIRIDEAAIKKANAAYWAACCTADRHLENVLRSAADAAHARNDGTEEQACLDAAKDVKERADAEGSYATVSAPVAPVTPLRFEQKDSEKKPDSKKTGGGKSDAGKAG